MIDISEILGRTSPRSEGLNDILNNWANSGRGKIKKQYKTICATYGKDIEDNQRQLDLPPKGIADTCEKAYQRAFFEAGKTTLNTSNPAGRKIINWLDYEVPVVFNGNSRRTSLDLIGKIDENSGNAEYTIAELKDIKGNSPFYAIFEVLEYALLIKNLSYGGGKPPYHGTNDYWGVYSDCKYLIVAAPTGYWKDWIYHLEKLQEVSEWVNETWGYEVVFARYEEENFIKQKNGNKTYYPCLQKNKGNIWTKL